MDSFGSMLADLAPVVAGEAKRLGENIQAGTYDNPQASLRTYAAAAGRLVRQAREAQINSEFPTFASGLFRKGVAAGYETEEVASLIKVLRGNGRVTSR